MENSLEKSLLIEYVEDIIGSYSETHSTPHSGWYAYNCPACAADAGEVDDKYNLSVNFDSNYFQCWKCQDYNGTRGSLYTFFDKFASTYVKKEARELLGKTKFTSFKKDVNAIFLPYGCKEIDEWIYGDKRYKKHVQHLFDERKLSMSLVKKHRLLVSVDSFYADRIIIPSYNKDKELNYFTTRTVENKKPTYIDCTLGHKNLIFNETLLSLDSTIYIVEGVFDHMVLPNSIPLLGKKMNDFVLAYLIKNAQQDIVLVLDNDLQDKEIKEFLEKLLIFFSNKLWIVKLPEKDPSLVYQLHGVQGLASQIKENGYKI